MTQLDQLRLMNNATILYLKKLNMSYERNSIISNILKDDSCFFKLSKQDAYTILEDIGVESQQIYLAYLDLISIDNYYSLKNSGKILDDDPEITIRYKDYNPSDLFKNNSRKKETSEINKITDISIVNKKENILKKLLNKIITWFKRR